MTFTKQIAPIVFKHCASCHRPGQAAPFSLLTFEDVRKRAQQIADVTKRRIMPPWLPEPGYGEFEDERVLQPDEVELIQRWIAQGSVEGPPSDLPLLPKWAEGWQLGQPDLIVEMPQAYMLPSEGKDLYRNFVIPIPVSGTRYVRAVEFRPGNPKVVHHAFIRIDQTRESRRLDALDSDVGFGGIHTPASAQTPEGQFMSWRPGKVAAAAPEGTAWRLEEGSDLVLQMHLQPSGRPESLRASVGIFFTDKPPTNIPYKIRLTSYDIDIPAGADDYLVKDSYTLPVDLDLLAILPHAHYLGKRIHGFATLPDGTRKWLLRIDEWNFDWQGDFRYAKPVFLPKGSTLVMEYRYDNSADNARNPNQPPQGVQYGLQSSDEMAELWLQARFRRASDRETFERDYQHKVAREVIAYNEYLLRKNPKDGRAQMELAKAMLSERRIEEALRHLQAAATNAPELDEPYYFLGLLLRNQKRLPEAKAAFERALHINSQNFKTHGNLGIVLAELGDLAGAERHFRTALSINPNDSIARESLDEVLQAKAKARSKAK